MSEIPEAMKPDDYWLIQISGTEAFFLLGELMATVLDTLTPNSGRPFEMGSLDNLPIYMLKRAHWPVELVSKYTGQPKEVLEQGGLIRLHVKHRPELPTPTVNYWGRA